MESGVWVKGGEAIESDGSGRAGFPVVSGEALYAGESVAFQSQAWGFTSKTCNWQYLQLLSRTARQGENHKHRRQLGETRSKRRKYTNLNVMRCPGPMAAAEHMNHAKRDREQLADAQHQPFWQQPFYQNMCLLLSRLPMNHSTREKNNLLRLKVKHRQKAVGFGLSRPLSVFLRWHKSASTEI